MQARHLFNDSNLSLESDEHSLSAVFSQLGDVKNLSGDINSYIYDVDYQDIKGPAIVVGGSVQEPDLQVWDFDLDMTDYEIFTGNLSSSALNVNVDFSHADDNLSVEIPGNNLNFDYEIIWKDGDTSAVIEENIEEANEYIQTNL